ncbi:MAG: hypothetical protein ACLFUA_08015 [Spirochaetales bacterium]
MPTTWFETSVTRHNDPKLPSHVLKALADLGVRACDPGIGEIIEQIEEHRVDALYAARQTLPDRENRTPDPDADEWHALPCDSPEIASALLQLGHRGRALERSVAEVSRRWSEADDWFCHFFFVESQYRRHQVGCPMAALMALDLIDRAPGDSDAAVVRTAFEPLEFPFVWFNALYLADVVSRFPELRETDLGRELIDWVVSGQDEEGRWRATSVFRMYKGFDFAQKREPSAWITLLCCRILKRWFG